MTTPLTPEQRKKKNEYERHRLASLPTEKREEIKQKNAICSKRWLQTRTPEQLEEMRKKRNEKEKERRKHATHEQKEKQKEYAKQWRKNNREKVKKNSKAREEKKRKMEDEFYKLPRSEQARIRAAIWYKEHKKYAIDRSVSYNRDHPEQRRKATAKDRHNIRIEVFKHYGGTEIKCACCGETIQEFLTLDHINNDGAKQRNEPGMPRGGTNFYRWLKKHNYPEGFQVLCWNCNCSKGYWGYCPHNPPENILDDRPDLEISYMKK